MITMRSCFVPLRLTAPLAIAAAFSLVAAAGCRPSAQKVKLGPFNADRYEATAPDGSRLDCFIFGAETNKSARLCGTATPTPGFAGLFVNATAAAANSKFVEAFGKPLDPGYYLLKLIGTNTVDTWALGKLGVFEWVGEGSGKILFAVETGADHHTRVRLIDPAARADRTLDAGPTRSDSWLLVRADNDAAIMLLQRLGGQEMISVRDPMGNAEITVADASDEQSPGNRRLMKRGELDRQNGGVFKPNVSVTSAFKWDGGKWLFEEQPLGPFSAPATK